MINIFFQYNHPVIGQLQFKLDRRAEFIQFDCDWPFDLTTNEWISITNQFPLKEFVKKVGRLPNARPAIIHGMHRGRMSLKALKIGIIEIRVADGSKGLHEECCFHIPARSFDLLPHAAHLRAN